MTDRSPDEVGTDPDVRFSFANERTFLAYNRTALALMTAGLAVTQLLPPFDVPGGRRMIGLPLIALGTLLAVASLHQWRRNERAMRLGRPLPRSVLPMLLAVVVAVCAVVALGARDRRAGGLMSTNRPPEPSQERPDDGLSAERTELAWSRSALSLLACGAATLRGIPNVTEGHPVTGSILLGLGGIVWLTGLPLARQRSGSGLVARRTARYNELVPVALGTVLVGVAALVLAALFPG